MSITQQKICCVNKRLASTTYFFLKTPQNRLGKSLLNRAFFEFIIANCPISIIGLNQQNFGADFLKFDDLFPAQLASIEANVIRTNTCWQGIYIKKFGIPFIYFEPKFSSVFFPKDIEKSFHFFHTCRFGSNGLDFGFGDCCSGCRFAADGC